MSRDFVTQLLHLQRSDYKILISYQIDEVGAPYGEGTYIDYIKVYQGNNDLREYVFGSHWGISFTNLELF